jgi:plastocyanin
MPAIAGSESAPTVEAVNSGLYYHYWVPPTATVAPGGTVAFSNPTSVRHGIEWVGAPTPPVCDPTVPVGTTESAAGTEWHGSCTFTTPGTYGFYCTVHGPAMSGTITVGATGTTTIVTSTATSTPGGGAVTSTGAVTSPPAGGAPGTSPAAGAGGIYSALKLAASASGRAGVRGSLTVGAASAGGMLAVELLAARAQLARAGGTAVLGRLVRRGIAAGPLAFRVVLAARGRAALRARGHLRLTVRVSITPPDAAAVQISRSLLLRR